MLHNNIVFQPLHFQFLQMCFHFRLEVIYTALQDSHHLHPFLTCGHSTAVYYIHQYPNLAFQQLQDPVLFHHFLVLNKYYILCQ